MWSFPVSDYQCFSYSYSFLIGVSCFRHLCLMRSGLSNWLSVRRSGRSALQLSFLILWLLCFDFEIELASWRLGLISSQLDHILHETYQATEYSSTLLALADLGPAFFECFILQYSALNSETMPNWSPFVCWKYLQVVFHSVADSIQVEVAFGFSMNYRRLCFCFTACFYPQRAYLDPQGGESPQSWCLLSASYWTHVSRRLPRQWVHRGRSIQNFCSVEPHLSVFSALIMTVMSNY